jgi:nonsense-mediated mRNA decay protein 3
VFCVECGRDAPEEDLRESLCPSCFLDSRDFSLAPDVVDLHVCVHCGARKEGEEDWVDEDLPLLQAVQSAVGDRVRVERQVEDPHVYLDVETEDPRNYRVQVTVDGLVERLHMEEHHQVRVRLKRDTCTRCSRFHGGYFEAIVQLRRARDREVDEAELHQALEMAEDIVERVRAEQGDRNAFILKQERIHGGLDLYVGTSKAARAIAQALSNAFGGKLEDSATLVGEQDGQERYRVTYSVRLPAYRVGDVVEWDDELHQVRSVSSKRIRLRRLADHVVASAEQEDLEEAPVIPRDEARDAVIVSRGPDEVQVLDPWTYDTRTLSVGAQPPPGSESVEVVRHRDTLAVLPDGGDGDLEKD